MDSIQYGWLDIENKIHLNTMKQFRKIYRTATLDECFTLKIGTCIEQVYMIKVLLEEIQVPAKMFCSRIYEGKDFNDLEDDEHMHCFVLYYMNDKVFQLEHPNENLRGIYEFENEEEAISALNQIYLKWSGQIARPITQFFEIPPYLIFKEFNLYINSLG